MREAVISQPMKLRERCLVGLVGFSLALVLLMVVEQYSLTTLDPNGSDAAQYPQHGVIRPRNGAKADKFSHRNLQKVASNA